jgi:hypothetical protein
MYLFVAFAHDLLRPIKVRNWKERPTGDWTLMIIDESEGDRGDCADLLFEYIAENPWTRELEIYSCRRMEDEVHCVNGKVVDAEAIAKYPDRGRDNRTAAEACCVCGGGVEVSKVNVLLSWSLTIYGHDADMNGNNTTTMATIAHVNGTHNSTLEGSATYMNTPPLVVNETATTDSNMTTMATNTTAGIGSSDNVNSFISSGSDPTAAPFDVVTAKEPSASTQQQEAAPGEDTISGLDSSQAAHALCIGNFSFLRISFRFCLELVILIIGLLL